MGNCHLNELVLILDQTKVQGRHAVRKKSTVTSWPESVNQRNKAVKDTPNSVHWV